MIAPGSGWVQGAGTWQRVRLILRLDRVRLVVWWAGIVGLVAVTAASVTELYSTPAELEGYARSVRGNSALIVQSGPGYGLDDPTVGAVMMNESSVWTIIAVGLMCVFMVVRHTRTEEESERAELVRAAPVGRHAPLVAATVAAALATALVAAACSVTLVAYDLPLSGSLAYGATLFGAGLVFSGVAAVTAQIAGGSRAALGLGGAVIGVSFVLRAIGDVGNGTVSWLSPIGWAQAIRAFADERWWVLALPLVTAVVLAATAISLQDRRDFGGGLVRQRLGPAAAAPWLSSPLALAIRLQYASLLGWIVGVGTIALFYGIVAEQAESILEENPGAEDFFDQLGQGSITDAFLSTSVLMLALLATGFTISAVLRLRTEEEAGRSDELIAAGVSRRRLASSHLAVSVGGTVVLMMVTGLMVGAGFALAVGDASAIGRVLGAAIVMIPAMLVFAGIALALYGISARWSPLVWAVFVWALASWILGAVLDVPDWVLDLSPFPHVPALPSASMSWLPVGLLCVAAAIGVVVGLVAFERRDIS